MLATRTFSFEIELDGLGIYATGTCTHLRGRIETVDLDGGISLEFSLFGASATEPTRRAIANAIKAGIERHYADELHDVSDVADTRADRLREMAL